MPICRLGAVRQLSVLGPGCDDGRMSDSQTEPDGASDSQTEKKQRTGQPAAMAGDTLRVIMDMGKFHGVIAATTLRRQQPPALSAALAGRPRRAVRILTVLRIPVFDELRHYISNMYILPYYTATLPCYVCISLCDNHGMRPHGLLHYDEATSAPLEATPRLRG